MNEGLISFMGGVTVVVAVICNQLKEVRTILLGEIICNLLVAFNCAVQGGLTGAWDCGLAAVLTIAIYQLNKSSRAKKQMWKVAVSSVYAAANVVILFSAYKGLMDIIPCLTAFLFVMKIVQDRADVIRVINVVGTILWIYYDYRIESYSNLVTHGLCLISVMIAIIRLDIKKNPVVQQG